MLQILQVFQVFLCWDEPLLLSGLKKLFHESGYILSFLIQYTKTCIFSKFLDVASKYLRNIADRFPPAHLPRKHVSSNPPAFQKFPVTILPHDYSVESCYWQDKRLFSPCYQLQIMGEYYLAEVNWPAVL